jgi:hypothetical protein
MSQNTQTPNFQQDGLPDTPPIEEQDTRPSTPDLHPMNVQPPQATSDVPQQHLPVSRGVVEGPTLCSIEDIRDARRYLIIRAHRACPDGVPGTVLVLEEFMGPQRHLFLEHPYDNLFTREVLHDINVRGATYSLVYMGELGDDSIALWLLCCCRSPFTHLR